MTTRVTLQIQHIKFDALLQITAQVNPSTTSDHNSINKSNKSVACT